MSTDGPMLVRRGEAMRILGVGWRTFDAMIAAKEVRPKYWGQKGRAWFVRGELEDVSIDTAPCAGGKKRE